MQANSAFLLQVLDDGRITDSQGRTVDFKNTVIILTSNLGSDLILEDLEKSRANGSNELSDEARNAIDQLLKRQFRPEFPVKKVREAREAIQRSALSTDAAGRVLFIYGAQNLNGSSANAMLKIIEEPPEGVLVLLTATSAATVLPTIRSRCAAYTIAPVPAADCAARLKAERLPAKAAE